MIKNIFVQALMTAVLAFCTFSLANGQTTNFTYQGKLSDNSIAANGTYDIQFTLFDAGAGGSSPSAWQNPVRNNW